MGKNRMDPSKQFSKKLATWTAVFWFAHMLLLTAVLCFEPRSAMPAIYMSIISSVIMLINIYSYCKNSLTEKALLALLDKTKMEINFGKNSTSENKEEEVENG